MEWFSPEFFDTLILANMVIALTLVGLRFYRDMTRPLRSRGQAMPITETPDDTQPSQALGDAATPANPERRD